MREGFPLKLPFTSLLFLPVSQNGAQAFFASTILAQRSDLREPVRCGPVPIRQAVVPAARSACMDTPPSRGPTGHSHCILQAPATMLSQLPARPRQRTTTAPLPEDGTAIRNRINVLGREELTGWWPQDRGRQERRCSGKRNEMLQKGPSPHLPSRKEAP